MPRALVSGARGQDGSYLVELLLAKGYDVVALTRSSAAAGQPLPVHERLTVVESDSLQPGNWAALIDQHAPGEIYHLAAQSSPNRPWDESFDTFRANAMAPVGLFEAAAKHEGALRIFFASSSEIFGQANAGRLDDAVPLQPRSAYGVSKTAAHLMARLVREIRGTFISCGILFTHESPRRPIRYVLQKVTHAAACIKAGITQSPELDDTGLPIFLAGKLKLGNIAATRDWGYAGDYVDAMWRALQCDKAQDFVIGTGVAHTVQDLCMEAFGYVGTDWSRHVEVEQALMRPRDAAVAVADPTKAAQVLGWRAKVGFVELVHMMVDHHYSRLVV